jgi:hypothetical protein
MADLMTIASPTDTLEVRYRPDQERPRCPLIAPTSTRR